MTTEFIYHFIRTHKYAVIATVSADHASESACIGIAVNHKLHIIFETLSDSRKYNNLLLNPKISLVIGWENEETIQYEGIAKVSVNPVPEELMNTYFEVFPDGRNRIDHVKNIAYCWIEPQWIRYSDFTGSVPFIKEIRF